MHCHGLILCMYFGSGTDLPCRHISYQEHFNFGQDLHKNGIYLGRSNDMVKLFVSKYQLQKIPFHTLVLESTTRDA